MFSRIAAVTKGQGRLYCSAFCTAFALGIAVPASLQNASLPLRPDLEPFALRLSEQGSSGGRAIRTEITAAGAGRFASQKTAIHKPALKSADKGTPAGRKFVRAFQPQAMQLFFTKSIVIANARLEERWRGVLAERANVNLIARCDTADEVCDQPRYRAMKTELLRLKDAPLEAKVRAVNEFVNGSFRYASDQSIYGVPDYWASLREFLSHGRGDCEDFAIAKMWMLVALGVPLERMRIVVLRDQIGLVDHAVLTVALEDRNLVLDNRSRVARDDRELPHYRPFYSMAASGEIWVHTAPIRQSESMVQAAQPSRSRASN